MKPWMLVVATVAAIAVALMMPAIPQDAGYHQFADQTPLFGVPNFWNVASNVPFLLVGAWGLLALPVLHPTIPRPTYLVFCVGVTLVGIGSSYYHYAPTSNTLVWDRLPMTLAFMALFSMVIGDRVSAPLGRRLLWPLVLAGVLSVMYWDWTELQGRGDLRAYGLVQFRPMVLIPLMLVTRTGNGLRASWLWATLGAYALAKLAEYFDVAIHAAIGVLSGHSLKHLLSALAVYFALLSMQLVSRR
ncbi:MAG: ceramidase domain-containing protein [Gammaproteobacteria bacterium]